MKYQIILLLSFLLLLSCFDSKFTSEHINVPSENGKIHKLHYKGFSKDSIKLISQKLLALDIFAELKPISVEIERANGKIKLRLPLVKDQWDVINHKAYYSSVKYDLHRFFKQEIELSLFDKGFMGNESMVFTADKSSIYQWMIDPTKKQTKSEIRNRLANQLKMFRLIYEDARLHESGSVYWHNIPANLRYASNGIGVRTVKLTSGRTKKNYYNNTELTFALQILGKSFSGVKWPKHDNIFDSYISVLKKLELNLSNMDIDNSYLGEK